MIFMQNDPSRICYNYFYYCLFTLNIIYDLTYIFMSDKSMLFKILFYIYDYIKFNCLSPECYMIYVIQQ